LGLGVTRGKRNVLISRIEKSEVCAGEVGTIFGQKVVSPACCGRFLKQTPSAPRSSGKGRRKQWRRVDYRTNAKSYNSNGPLIGEIWPNASQWLTGDQMDAVMNYRFRKNIIGFVRNAEWHDDNNNGTNDIPALTPSQFDNALRAVRDDYPPQATAAMLNLPDSHDVNRALYVMTEAGDTGLVQAKKRLELAALFQFTYVGAPMVYYGDEVAVNSPSLASSNNGPMGDPYARPPYPSGWIRQAIPPSTVRRTPAWRATTRRWRTCANRTLPCVTDHSSLCSRAIPSSPSRRPIPMPSRAC